MVRPGEVVEFWRDAGARRWYSKDDSFDALCTSRFLLAHEAASGGELRGWEDDAEGALALVLLLDQFPRNMFRGTARAFDTDPAALAVASRAIERGHDQAVDPTLRQFFYTPFMHAEDLARQDRALTLFEAAHDPENLKWARHHRDIIARFGRFPHRNALLGRETTPEEAEFLAVDSFRG
jgi:uncharacterized protein (DUF924 family)